MTNLEKAKDLQQNFVFAGKMLDGFEKYYAENLVMQEVGEEPRVSKAVNRTHEINFSESIKEFHGGAIVSIGADDANNKTFVESWMEVTFKNDYKVKMQQVAAQTWENGLIVNEIFYHK